MIWFEFEKALKILVSYFPEEPMKKPTLFHSLRVWTYLWNNCDIAKSYKSHDCYMIH